MSPLGHTAVNYVADPVSKGFPRATPAQIVQWLTCVGFPDAYSEVYISSGVFPVTLDNLHILTRLSTIAFPIKNAALH